MNILPILTILYLIVLVAALAISLLAILVYLRRIGKALAAAREALAQVCDHTDALQAPLQAQEASAAAAAANLALARARFAQMDERLRGLAERRGLFADESRQVGT